jgi:membrane dipeptidase
VNARDFHQHAVVVDAHNDLPVLLLLRNATLGMHKIERFWSEHWVPEARAGGVDVQVLPIYVSPAAAESSLRVTLLQLEALEREAAQTPEVALCRTGREIDDALDDQKVALLLALEGTQGVGADVELLSVFHRLGVRMVSFTHWSRALLAEGSADEQTGSRLPAAGVRAVAELDRLGILLDVSHLAAASVDHVLEVTTRTVVASHSCCRALRDHHRNLSDEHLRGIAATGGVIGMNFLPTFVHETEPTIDRVVDHLEHMVEVAGIGHVGLGPDFLRPYIDAVFPQYDRFIDLEDIDMKAVVPGLARERDLPNLTERMVERGWAEGDVRQVLGENWLRVFRTLG